MGQQMTTEVICCQPEAQTEKGGGRRAEMTFFEDGSNPDGLPQMRGCRPENCRPEDYASQVFVGGSLDPDEWGCSTCRSRDDPSDNIMTTTPLESLSYVPIRFDANSTIDAERSHSRYSKIVVHSTRARTQRRSKAWEEWLRAATGGRPVTLLLGPGFQTQTSGGAKEAHAPAVKVQAMYYLDRALTKLSIVPAESEDSKPVAQPISIPVDNIQVICPLTDFMLLEDVVEAELDEGERGRAALLQFIPEGADEQKRVCFLEESENAKDRFVQALTALWLEKRNDHSMWF